MTLEEEAAAAALQESLTQINAEIAATQSQIDALYATHAELQAFIAMKRAELADTISAINGLKAYIRNL